MKIYRWTIKYYLRGGGGGYSLETGLNSTQEKAEKNLEKEKVRLEEQGFTVTRAFVSDIQVD